MALLNWDNNLSINIKEIDEQHKKLIGIINELHESMTKGKSKEIMDQILMEMLNYTKYHFTTEEKLMANHNYTEQLAHRKEHEKFIQQAILYQENYQKGSLFISVDILNFLSTWVQNHIKETDKKYAHYLNSKGVY